MLELLAQHGYTNVPVVRGSALRALYAAGSRDLTDPFLATIDELVAAMDSRIR